MAPNGPSDWRTLLLEDCMEAIIDYRGKTPRKTAVGIPLITAKIVKNGRIEKPEEFIDPEDYDTWMRRGLPRRGDIVMTTEAPLGEIAQLDDASVALAQRLITLRGKPGILDNTFLKFLMQSEFVQNQLKARATGTTVLGIKQSELRRVSLVVPPLPEQRAIAHILGTLDDKIELNRRMNETLEAMARAIFKSWFADFDPVRDKMEGRDPLPAPQSEAARQAGGLPPHLAALFPDRFEESELGEIPAGWEVVPLPEAIEVNPSRSLTKGQVAPYLDMQGMPTTGHRYLELKTRPFGSGTKFLNGDTLLARITPCLENGKTAFVDFLENGQVGWGSTEYIIFRPKPPLPVEYGYYLARSDALREYAIQNMTGTSGRQRVPPSCFDNYLMVVPPAPIAQMFGGFAQSVMAKVQANDSQSRTLAALRDALLPNLLSGEIRVRDAEKSMVEVL